MGYSLVYGGHDLSDLVGLGLLAQAVHREVEVESVDVQSARAAHKLAEKTHSFCVLTQKLIRTFLILT